MNLLIGRLLPFSIYIANLFANTLGVISVEVLVHRRNFEGIYFHDPLSPIRPFIFFGGFVVLTVFSLIYDAPIRRLFSSSESMIPAHIAQKARKRVLNATFALNTANLSIWVTASIVHYFISSYMSLPIPYIHKSLLGHLFTGAITAIFAFFLCEKVLQRIMIPILFPNGGIWSVPNVKRMTIRKRMVLLLLSVNTIPFLVIITLVSELKQFGFEVEAKNEVVNMLIYDSLLFIAIGFAMTWLVGSSIRKGLINMVDVLKDIKNGRFDRRVDVRTNDEIGYVGDSINEMAKGLIEREVVKELFGKYVSKEVRDQILEGSIPLDGDLKEVTMLFCDLRNYTGLVHKFGPKKAVKVLNHYFEEMEEAIRSNGGVVIQFIGDEIEAVFGAPIQIPDHSQRALKASVVMCERLDVIKKELEFELEHGIGIHTGIALAANIGSPSRLSYALVGDTVNIASRIQELTKELNFRILVSEATLERVEDKEGFKELGKFTLKGIQDPVTVYGFLPA